MHNESQKLFRRKRERETNFILCFSEFTSIVISTNANLNQARSHCLNTSTTIPQLYILLHPSPYT